MNAELAAKRDAHLLELEKDNKRLTDEIEKMTGEMRFLMELVKEAPNNLCRRWIEERLNKVWEARDRLCSERGDALMCNL